MAYEQKIPTGTLGSILYGIGELGKMLRFSKPIDVEKTDAMGNTRTEQVNPFSKFFGGVDLGKTRMSIVPPGQESEYEAVSRAIASKGLAEMLGLSDIDSAYKKERLRRTKLEADYLEKTGTLPGRAKVGGGKSKTKTQEKIVLPDLSGD